MNVASHNAVSSPATAHPGDDIVERLQASQLFRDYQQAFQTATGLPLMIRAAGSFKSPLQGSRNINPFCALMAGTSKTCAACLQLQQRAEAQATEGSSTVECFAGLNESVVPIRIGEKIVAFLQTGQVLLRAPTETRFRAAMKQLLEWNPDANVAEFHAAFFKTRVLTKAHYEAVVRLLGSFAQHLSLLSNELAIKETAAEPPAVGRARAFIAERLGEALSLPDVARAAHMSPFYFCKIFKSATGHTFTAYVSRTRVEKVKQLLLNPHTRVSEAAYAAGFQSLSQFNRVFRRIAGESPSTYRETLHGASEPLHPRASLACAA